MKTTDEGTRSGGDWMANNKTGRVQSAGQVCERFEMKMPSNAAGKSISHAYCQRPGSPSQQSEQNRTYTRPEKKRTEQNRTAQK